MQKNITLQKPVIYEGRYGKRGNADELCKIL